MSRRLLSVSELQDLDAALIEAYRMHSKLCETHPIARGKISRPGIPPAFSESLTALLLGSFYGEGATVAYGGKTSDLVLFMEAREARTIEVKASGVSRFQELKERDLAADALVWVDFGARYVAGRGPVTFHHLPNPKRFVAPRRKLTLNEFLRGVGQFEDFQSIAVADIGALLAGETNKRQVRFVGIHRSRS
jgi:hypothetical protein